MYRQWFTDRAARRSQRGIVQDIKQTARGLVTHDTLRDLSDERLDDTIKNTQANQASLTKFYNALIDERVRRGLKLPAERFLDDDQAAQF